jgi:ribosomal protein L14E/L6E/L27E
MEIKKGLIVKSKAGHDAGCFFVVVDFDGEYAYISDGKRRPISHLKKKKIKHLAFTNKVVQKDNVETNHRIKKALYDFQINKSNL